MLQQAGYQEVPHLLYQKHYLKNIPFETHNNMLVVKGYILTVLH
jgi:hypothetical protein